MHKFSASSFNFRMLEISVNDLKADPALAEMAGATDWISRTDVDWDLNSKYFVYMYDLLAKLDARLRVAMGPVVDIPNHEGNQFYLPSYLSYIYALDDALWYAVGVDYRSYPTPVYIVPYNEIYGGWRSEHVANKYRSGFMCSAMNIIEYVHHFQDEKVNRMPPTKELMPDLYDDATFGTWLNLLPQPVSLELKDRYAKLSWGRGEPRVHRADEMGRYQLTEANRYVETKGLSHRHARALAYVMAWEKMAANEPEDRYLAQMLQSRAQYERDRGIDRLR